MLGDGGRGRVRGRGGEEDGGNFGEGGGRGRWGLAGFDDGWIGYGFGGMSVVSYYNASKMKSWKCSLATRSGIFKSNLAIQSFLSIYKPRFIQVLSLSIAIIYFISAG